MSFIDHAEKYLGNINKGWKDKNRHEWLKIVSFKDCPGENVTTFLSLGMSNRVLSLSESKEVRQEIVLPVYSTADSTLIVSFLLSLCETILNRKEAVRRGDVIALSNETAEKIGFDAIYCAIPVYSDEEFSVYDESSPPTVVVWTLPIYSNEVDYINANGWNAFEDLLEEKDPDLCSLSRDAVV